MRFRHLALVALVDIIWAVNIVAIKVSVDAVRPLTANMLRYAIVLLACLPWLRWLPGRMLLVLVTGLVAGALFMGLGGLSYAVADNVSALAVAGQLGVPFSLLLAIVFYHERIRWVRMTGIALSFAGVAVMAFDPRIFDERLGLMLTAAASMCWATGNLLFRKLQGTHVLTLQAWLAVVSIPVLGLGSVIFEPGQLGQLGSVPLHVWGWIAYSAIA